MELLPLRFPQNENVKQFLRVKEDMEVISTIREHLAGVQQALTGQSDWKGTMMRKFNTLYELRKFIRPLLHTKWKPFGHGEFSPSWPYCMVDKLVVSVRSQDNKPFTAAIRDTPSINVTSAGTPRAYSSINYADKIIVTMDRRKIITSEFHDLFQYPCGHRNPENIIVVVTSPNQDGENLKNSRMMIHVPCRLGTHPETRNERLLTSII